MANTLQTTTPAVMAPGTAPGGLAPVNTGELAQTAAAARAQAEVQARYTIAMARPRNLEGVRMRLLEACGDWEFANEAMYRLPYGDNSEGLSVRFAETARQEMGNMVCSRCTLHDSEALVVARVSVTDLERNAVEEREVSVEKVIERKKLRRGEVPLGTRVGSTGDTVYLCRPGASEVKKLLGADVAKAERDCTLKLLRGGIKKECTRRIKATIRDGAKGNEGEERRRDLLERFHRLRVSPEDIVRWLGHPIAQMNPTEFEELHGVVQAMRSEGLPWASFLEARHGQAEEAAAPTAKTSAAKEALKQRAATNGKPQ